jgi:hypothetical protein
VHSNESNVVPFGLVNIDNKLILNLVDGSLELEEVQLEGKKRGSGSSYIYLGQLGYKL